MPREIRANFQFLTVNRPQHVIYNNPGKPNRIVKMEQVARIWKGMYFTFELFPPTSNQLWSIFIDFPYPVGITIYEAYAEPEIWIE